MKPWSVRYVRAAGGPVGIFTRINHDNNHHLNSLWLYLVGPAAPPLLARALAIVTGTVSGSSWPPSSALAVARPAHGSQRPVRGRRSDGDLWIGSPRLCADASCIACRHCDSSTAGSKSRQAARRRQALAIVCAIGAMAHMTMLLGVLLLGAWDLFLSRPADSRSRGIRTRR